MFPFVPATSDLFKVVLYRSTLSCHDLLSVTVGGYCAVGPSDAPCDMLDLGASTMVVIPWLRATHQIFYSLVLFSSVEVLLFYLDVDRSWSSKRQLKAYRRFIVALQVLCCVAGTAATILGFGMMLAPALDVESTSLIDVQIGWGQIFTIATTLLMMFLTVAFFHESRVAADACEGSLSLEDEESSEFCPLLVKSLGVDEKGAQP